MLDAVELTQALVRLDTSSGNEASAVELLAPLLRGAGADVIVDTLSPERASLVALAGPRTRPPLVLSGHLDTVKADKGAWTFDPWSGTCADGHVRGRGSSDMKGGVSALVSAFERYLRQTAEPADVCLVLTAGEESGCLGALHLLEAPLIPAGGPLLVAEPTACRLATGHKGALWLRVTSHGVAAHGSRPDLGRNAITPLARIAVALAERALPGEHPQLGKVTANVGTIEGGTATNLVPSHATLSVDIRTVPGVEPDRLIETVRSFAGPAEDVTIETIVTFAPVYSDPDGPFVSLMAEACRAVQGRVVPSAPLTYFTDASVLVPRLGCPEVAVLGPGDPDLAHAVDESCSAHDILEAAAIYHSVLEKWGSRP
ncbi:MAG: M20 family metallopeptidase [Actinomycetia bacterium]|nr:M20 family metallopeptidase [Actinomycetes bacterium]